MITKEIVENSVAENEAFISMVCKGKYKHDNIQDVIEDVIEYCGIEDTKQQDLMRDGKFIPAGSILSKCVSDTKGSFSNCYATPITEDSMHGIFKCQEQLANTFRLRGGSGYDITTLRPKHSPVNNAAKTSSGAVSFLPLFSEVGRVVGTNGRR